MRTRQAVLVGYDETEIHWCADIGKGYQLTNEQNRITSPGQDEVKYLLGRVVYPTGEGLYQILTVNGPWKSRAISNRYVRCSMNISFF